MNKSLLILGFAALLVTGCAPKVARQPLTETEQQWNDFVKSYYPAWKHTPTVAAAFKPSIPSSSGKSPVVTNEPLPQMPQMMVSELVFEEDGGSLDPALIPNNDDVVAIEAEESVVVENTVPAIAQEAIKETPETDKEEKKIDAAQEYVVQKGDMLGALARKFYGKASLWPVIQKANEEQLKNSTSLRPGMKLIIPAL